MFVRSTSVYEPAPGTAPAVAPGAGGDVCTTRACVRVSNYLWHTCAAEKKSVFQSSGASINVQTAKGTTGYGHSPQAQTGSQRTSMHAGRPPSRPQASDQVEGTQVSTIAPAAAAGTVFGADSTACLNANTSAFVTRLLPPVPVMSSRGRFASLAIFLASGLANTRSPLCVPVRMRREASQRMHTERMQHCDGLVVRPIRGWHAESERSRHA